MKQKFDPRNTISRHKGIFTTPPEQVPSNKVVDGPIIGNGDVGVVVSGAPEMQRLWISKNDFWKAKRLFPNGSPCLLGGVDVSIPSLTGGSYYSEQRIYEAEIASTFQNDQFKVAMCAWVAATENLLIVELVNEGQDVPVKIDLWVQSGHESETNYGREGELFWASRQFSGTDLDWATEGVLAMYVFSETGNEFVLEAGQKVVVAVLVMTNHDTVDCLNESLSRISFINEISISPIRFLHENWWQQFWSKSNIEIGDELLEKFWYGSHYIMACCSRNKQFPPGLFGNWITTDTPAWAGDYHLNYNHQAPWWGIYTSNHIELAEPFDTPILQYVPTAQKYAAEYLGCRGVYFDVGIGPKGLPTALCGTPYEDGHMFLGQKSNASYCAVNMLMRFYHTYDLFYAEHTAYPFLLEVANFWEDYLKFEDNRYIIFNDAVREVEVWTELHEHEDWANGFEDMNPIVSLGLIRAVFKGVLDISAELGLDTSRRAKWSHILEHISDFPTYEQEGKTLFRLTEKGYGIGTDNTIEIQHIFPAGSIGLSSDSKLLEIARDTITVINRWTDYNGFATIFTAAARVGYRPEIILDQLTRQFAEHSFPNLFIFFGGGGIECCSGVPSAINELLLQSHEHMLRLFPVWPQGRNARFENLRAVGAFLVSSSLTDGEVTYIEIESEKGRTCRVLNQWGSRPFYVVECDHTQQNPIAYSIIDNVISFETVAGKLYKLLPEA